MVGFSYMFLRKQLVLRFVRKIFYSQIVERITCLALDIVHSNKARVYFRIRSDRRSNAREISDVYSVLGQLRKILLGINFEDSGIYRLLIPEIQAICADYKKAAFIDFVNRFGKRAV